MKNCLTVEKQGEGCEIVIEARNKTAKTDFIIVLGSPRQETAIMRLELLAIATRRK